ncbi:MAG TPA: gamma-glutamyl-gamma-aminobutyrate hydrolase family protein, partial [Pseudonocardiaceae bacterium]|nr:gamma-glutamyl-gamma-aminobutyrate hydrolase family protein [Pseudonocardiaceae bacterium]
MPGPGTATSPGSRTRDEELFAGIPQEFVAVRYHSLRVEEPLPAELIPTAWAEDGVIMALRHRHLPRWGVQFHPESIASRYGRELLANFRDLSIDSIDAKVKFETRLVVVAGSAAAADRAVQTPPASSLRLITTVMPKAVDTEAVFLEFFESSPTCFWLDSSRVEAGLSRFSFLGDASGPLSEVLSYRISTGAVTVADADGVRVESGSIFDVLERRLRERQLADPDLPFDFSGGYVGYFGYELKTDCGAGNQHSSDTPDAIWIFADRLVAVDHEIGLTYVLAVTR